MGPAPLWVYGPPPKLFFYILRSLGCVLDKFWPIWLSVLALLRKAIAAQKDKKYNRLFILTAEAKFVISINFLFSSQVKTLGNYKSHEKWH